ncbi:PilZ domain-containing protein [Marinobacter zhejiangensis]|uniref:PilZ domain-containing protein n=1 Tax=Marinobacter zhejiangensis TaxID=488535 RepID=A0A1I4P7R0_9GAMM|nr:PilZ domain-containing protein [Marinobacter zhejiangensis]SFM23403.1 PilZ domain-containing protein [Marinobacter zhejiangensis]
MAAQNRREHLRTAFSAKVSVEHARLGSLLLSTRDVSDGGVFIVVTNAEITLELGDCVKVQVQGLPVPAPVREMVVVRKSADGYGLQFSDS